MTESAQVAALVAALHRAEVPRRVNRQLAGGVRGVWVGHWRRSPDAPLHSLALPISGGPWLARLAWGGRAVVAGGVSHAVACDLVGAPALLDGLGLLLVRLLSRPAPPSEAECKAFWVVGQNPDIFYTR